MPYRDGDIQWLMRHAPFFGAAGLALLVLGNVCLRLFGFEFGMFAGFMALWLGASAATFEKWRTEPGLWMLSALFLPLVLGSYGMFLMAQFPGIAGGPPAAGIFQSIDLTLATLLGWKHVRLLAIVTRRNWTMSRTDPMSRTHPE